MRMKLEVAAFKEKRSTRKYHTYAMWCAALWLW